MRRILVLGIIAAGVSIGAGVVWAGSGVATNPVSPLSASMQLVSSYNNGQQTCFNWKVTGKVRPSFRGFGTQVQLICTTPANLGNGAPPTDIFPNAFVNSDNNIQQCDGPCSPATADPCGNVTFYAQVCGDSPKLDPSKVCFFTVHLENVRSPQSCNKQPPNDTFPPDPNGSQQCGGDDTLCPAI